MNVQTIITIASSGLALLFGAIAYFMVKEKVKWKLMAKESLATIELLRREKEKSDRHADMMRRRQYKLEEISLKIQNGTFGDSDLNDLRSGILWK